MAGERTERKVKVIIECQEYSIPKSTNDKLTDLQNNGDYDSFNKLLHEIRETYTAGRSMSNIYYFQ
jgi:hypothetical protein